MLHTSDCATRSITGHVSLPSVIPSAAPDILRCANVATRTDVLSVVSRIDCLPWRVSFYSDRRCLIRILADLPHDGCQYSQRAKTSCDHGEVSCSARAFVSPFANRGSFSLFSAALCSGPAGGVF